MTTSSTDTVKESNAASRLRSRDGDGRAVHSGCEKQPDRNVCKQLAADRLFDSGLDQRSAA
jgi:hypothetical protein